MTALSELLAGSWLDNWLMIIPLMFVCLFINMPVWLAMFCGILTYFLCYSNVPLMVAIQRLIATTQTPSLLAIPFFILLGTLMSYTGIAARILQIANVLIGRMRGGLGGANILVSTMMGGVSASNLADVSIGSMFMAGILPGLLCSAMLIVTVWLVAIRRGLKPSSEHWPKPKEVSVALVQAWPALFLIVAVIGGIRANIFTPTEAGAVAVLLVMFIGFVIYRELKISHVFTALSETARSTASVMLIIMASAALGWIFSLERAGITVAEFVTSLTDNKYVFLLIINLLLLVLGMFLEGSAILLILVPLLKPVVAHFGIDPVHFGIIMILNLSLGTLSPPVGTVMLLVCNTVQVSVGQFMREAVPLLISLILLLLVITYIPAISLLLV
ncbi:TPA: TRAP transporter large permease [Escherichia coli]|nr:TRAP transporter large permease [Escherichia coli]HEC4392366.1 TRAP transporter large permease [Escherichia coli]